MNQEVQDVLKWMNDGELGRSSRFMAAVLCGVIPDTVSYPHDPDDFKRCVFLLERVPSFRAKLSQLKPICPEWSNYVDHWDEMEKLFKEEYPKKQAPKLYALMQELQKKAVS